MINPIGMTAVEWTDRMALLLTDVAPLKLNRDEDWRAWARHLCQIASISRYNPPNPEQFSDWREWAERFNNTVRLD